MYGLGGVNVDHRTEGYDGFGRVGFGFFYGVMKLKVFSDLELRAKTRGGLGLTLTGFCGENLGFVIGYGLRLIWYKKLKGLMGWILGFYGVMKIKESKKKNETRKDEKRRSTREFFDPEHDPLSI